MLFNNILIIGSGIMGVGVACVYALKGLKVNLVVRDENAIVKVKETLQKNITRLISKNKIDVTPEIVISRIDVVSVLEPNRTFDFIFEAVAEDANVKKSVITRYANFATADTIWASNTSSLSITDLASHYQYPGKFIGLHFFNPVSNMELVEIIPSMLTEPMTIEACWEFCLKLDKKPVRVEDSPGFIVNRLLIPMINEAIVLLESKIATVEEIDSAMKLGAHHPLGPLALADLIGIDVCLSIMKALYTTTCDSKYRPSYLLQKMVSANKLGRKTGQGFYLYPNYYGG